MGDRKLQNHGGVCAMCNTSCSEFVKSHLMPKAMFVDLLDEGDLNLIKVETLQNTASPSKGLSAPLMYKICGLCEGKFQNVDNDFIRLYRKLDNLQKADINQYLCIVPKEWNLKLLDAFFASVLLRYHVDGQLDLGRYYNTALSMLEKYNDKLDISEEQKSIVAGLFIDTARINTKNIISSNVMQERDGLNMSYYKMILSHGITCFIRVSSRPHYFEKFRDNDFVVCCPLDENFERDMGKLSGVVRESKSMSKMRSKDLF